MKLFLKKISYIGIVVVLICFAGSELIKSVNINDIYQNWNRFRFSKVVYIFKGQSFSKLALELEKDHLIHHHLLFKLYAKYFQYKNNFKNFKYGEYNIIANEKYDDFLFRIYKGDVVKYSIVFPEGLETREILDIINKNEVLAGEVVSFDKEGYLMPETYIIERGYSRQELLKKMQSDMMYFVEKQFQEAKNLPDSIKNTHDLLTLASIVQKEYYAKEQAPLVASVYLNRLAKNMKLQADPTTIYEVTKGKFAIQRPLNKKDLEIKGSYNTYQKQGLPINPINNPGKEAIMSVLNAPKTDYLYFVNEDQANSKLVFSKDYHNHSKAVTSYRKKVKKISSSK